MKKLLLLVLSFILITGSLTAAGASSAPEIKRSLYTTLYMQGEHAFTLGNFKIPLAEDAKVHEISLVGAGELIKLSWNTYTSRGNLVIEIQSEEIISTGTEKYMLSAHVGNAFISESFSISIVDEIPFNAEDIAVDIPETLHVGESFEISKLQTHSGKSVPKNTSLSFRCKDSRLTETGDNHYTATAAGNIPWTATLKNSNYSHKLSGEIAVTVKPTHIESQVCSIDVSELHTSVVSPLPNGYEVLGTILVCADIAEDDILQASLYGAEDYIELFLCDPMVTENDYLYAVIAANAQGEGTSTYTFTATAGDCSVSTTFDISVISAE